MGSHFHQGGVIYALGRNDWGSHFPGGVIRDFDTGTRYRLRTQDWKQVTCAHNDNILTIRVWQLFVLNCPKQTGEEK